MGLKDFAPEVTDDEQNNDDSDNITDSGHLTMAGIENNIRNRAIQDRTARVNGRTIEVRTDLLARWFALMCLDYEEADLPEPDTD